ncbi:GAF domain-containing sensor histidine kinase [Halalkalibacterium ligniniphilum]|uniref:GAF domain-containing sensor histidine kinase n=1 Tax=Halalkalibacterium ligniniphilum TaxID=1134413 RepID=UPI00034AF500|nr:GAF domain-containing sensor histidine kinase [Halalkalibacterium ligniniphilum]
MTEKHQMIELLTGVQSSKRNYYHELKRTLFEMQKKNMLLEIMNEVMRNFNIDMSMDDMLKNILDKLKAIFNFDRISLSILKDEQLVLSNVYPKESMYMKHGTTLPKNQSLYWKSVETKQILFYVLPIQSKNFYLEIDALEKFKIKSFLLFPLFSKGKVIGVLSIGSKNIITYDDSDLSFLQQLSDQFAVCLENARLYNEVLNGKKEWEDTFRAVVEPIIVMDLNGKILRVNAAGRAFFGLNEQELYHKKLEDLLPEEKEMKQLFDQSKGSKQTASCELRLIDQRIYEAFSYPVFNEQKRMYGVILYLRDVSEKRRIEAQLIHSGKLAAIGEMAAGVAHELNNPLTAILGNSQLLLRMTNREDHSYKLLSDIDHCGKRCKNIIENLLTFSRQNEFLFEECSVNEAIDQVLTLIGYQIERQNIIINVKKDPHIPLIQGNLQQIGQIIINLLLNAKDALELETLNKKVITLETFSRNEEGTEWTYLTVQDNGRGITEAHLQEIFNPFFTTKRATKGTGLGLSVSLGIAEAHGGTIQVESSIGKGSIFTLRLPAGQ